MVEIKLVKHSEEKGQLLDLFRASFGHGVSEEYWNWKYLQNSLASTDPEVIVASDNGRIVGARPFLLADMWLQDEKGKTAQHCDTMVHPEYQGKGIFNRMGQFSIEYLKENGYVLSYGFPGPMSRTGFLKQGWRVVVQKETMLRVLDPRKLIEYKLSNKLLGNGLGFLYSTLLNTSLKELPQTSTPFQVEVFDRFSDELKGIDTLRDISGIDLVRDENYLRWRFDKHPVGNYRYIIAKRDEELWGYAVIDSREGDNNLVYGFIIDYLVKHGDVACFQMLIGECLKELAKSRCDIVTAWMFGNSEFKKQLLKRFNFKSSLQFPYNRVFSYGYMDAIRVNEHRTAKVDIYDKENWRVTYAYADTR